MNDKFFKDQVRQDAAKIKEDSSMLVGDVAARLGRFENDVNQATSKAKEDLTTWATESVSQLDKRAEKLSEEAKGTVTTAAATVKKEVGQGFHDFNTKAQEIADKVPGDFSKQAAKYPWVAISIAIVVGFVVGSFIKPSRQ